MQCVISLIIFLRDKTATKHVTSISFELRDIKGQDFYKPSFSHNTKQYQSTVQLTLTCLSCHRI